jgi:hypothetical protein
MKTDHVKLCDIYIPDSVEDLAALKSTPEPSDEIPPSWQPAPPRNNGMMMVLVVIGAASLGSLVSYQNIERKKVCCDVNLLRCMRADDLFL